MKSEALAIDEPAAASLQAVLDNLKLAAPQIQAQSAIEEALSERVYNFEENIDQTAKFSIYFAANEAVATITTPLGDNVIHFGRGEWLSGAPLVNEAVENHKFESLIHSSFTWQDDNTLLLTIRYVETPFYHTIICRFEGEDIVLQRSLNISFGPTESTPIRGKYTNG